MTADKSRCVGAVGFHDVAGGPIIDELACLTSVAEFKHVGRRKAELAENPLGVSTIILKPRPIGTAADHVVPLASQAVLQRAASRADIFE